MTVNQLLLLLEHLLWTLASVHGRTIKVYDLNKNLKLNLLNQLDIKPDCLYYRGEFPMPTKLTFCYRWNAFQYTGLHKVLFIMTLGVIDHQVTELHEGFSFGYWTSGPWLGIKPKGKDYSWIGHQVIGSTPHQWTHTCFTYNLDTGVYKLVENGKLQLEKVSTNFVELAKNMTSAFNFLSVGCSYRKDLYKYSSMQGKITDVQAWDAELDVDEMKDITSCKNRNSNGTLLNWQTTDWTFDTPRSLSTLEEYHFEEICRISNVSFLFLPQLSTFKDSLAKSCGKFSGKLASYKTQQEFGDIEKFLTQKRFYVNDICMFESPNNTSRLVGWLGLSDDEKEGEFRSVYTNIVPDYFSWVDGRPLIDGVTYNCLTFSLAGTLSAWGVPSIVSPSVRDDDCEFQRCSLCEVPDPSKAVQVRGLCKESIYDTTYHYTVSDKGRPVYVGLLSSAIWYDHNSKHWSWVDRKEEGSVATSTSKLETLFVGLNRVDFENTSDACVKGQPHKVVDIKMTTCKRGRQFTCNDGLCVSMEQRCDQIINCQDGSDEDNCKILEMRSNYNKRIPPFLFDSVNNKIVPANVSVSIIILSFVNSAEVEHLFTLKFVFVMRWYDHRIKFYNLKLRRSDNALTVEDIGKLWIPNIIFSSTLANEAVIGTKDTVLTITREGKHTPSEIHIMEEINIFEGIENVLTFEMTYTKSFQCEFQLAMYPFDTQTCIVNMTINKLEHQSLTLTPKAIKMVGKTILPQYLVTSWKMGYRNSSSQSQGIQVTLTLKRRIINEMLTSYLPTTIILMVVYCTNYFKMSHFNTALTINLTAMLLLTTLFIGVSNSLPKVAYVKVRTQLITN